MQELRWNPLLGTWTMVAANRQDRPHLPEDWCPFCPASGKVPEDYDAHVYDNDFPALSQYPESTESESELYRSMQAYGKCEVILYSPDHHMSMSRFSVKKIRKIIDCWDERFRVLSEDKKIKYIFQFENKGEQVGVTMHHPHGQLYAYPFVPLKILTELENAKKYFDEHGQSVFQAMNRQEAKTGKRMIFENDSFSAYIPYFTDYPYGVFIVSKNRKSSFTEFEEKEKNELAEVLQKVTGAFDELLQKAFPYMMCIHQVPVNVNEYRNAGDYYDFHIEFYPPLREESKIKWYASSEMGAWAAANTLSVEECAASLRKALRSFDAKS